jgi:hypothetical protein
VASITEANILLHAVLRLENLSGELSGTTHIFEENGFDECSAFEKELGQTLCSAELMIDLLVDEIYQIVPRLLDEVEEFEATLNKS